MMRILFFLLSFYFITTPVSAQVPTQKEMQAQMQEVVNELNKQIADLEKQIAEAKKNKEDDSVIKELEDQLAMLKKQVEMIGGVSKGISKISDKTIQQAAIKDRNKDGVPTKDIKRIKMLPDKIFSDNDLAVFVKKIHSEAERLLSKEGKVEALKIYTALKSEKKSSDYISNVASSLWMTGYTEPAIYILGKECVANMNNENNLNNYAAFLTMADGGHAAIPIFQNLNKKYPSNSTILNNMGQAWFGLGDMNNANRYLDSAIKLYPRHSQANLTKSEIQESEGKTQESIESVKRSIAENYTPEKEARLEKLGGKLEYKDVPFRYPWKAQPLGIEKFIFIFPEYPFEGGEAAELKRMEWDDFRKQLGTLDSRLSDEIEVLKKKVEVYNAKLLANPLILKPYNNPVYRTASRKLELLVEWFTDQMVKVDKKIQAAKDTVDIWEDEYRNAIQAAEEAHKNEEDRTAYCNEAKGIATAFLTKANTLWQERNNELITIYKQYINSRANLTLYTSTDKSVYDYMIASMKREFINTLANSTNCRFEVGCMAYEPPQQGLRKPLPDFDSLTCKYKDDIFIPPFTTIKTECNKMSTEFDIDTELGVKIKVGWEENLNKAQPEWYNPLLTATKGTLELGYEAGINEDYQHLGGPFKGEIKVEGAVGMEITETGIKEVYIKGKASAELTGFVDEKDFMESKGSGIVNVEMKSSWNAGSKGKEGTISTGLSGQAGEGSLKIINWSTPQIKSK